MLPNTQQIKNKEKQKTNNNIETSKNANNLREPGFSKSCYKAKLYNYPVLTKEQKKFNKII